MSCWITGGRCPYGFEGGILSARAGFCKDCAQFSLNVTEIKSVITNLEIEVCNSEFISEEDQGEIYEYSNFLRDLISERLTFFADKKLTDEKLSDFENHENDVLKFLDGIFKKM